MKVLAKFLLATFCSIILCSNFCPNVQKLDKVLLDELVAEVQALQTEEECLNLFEKIQSALSQGSYLIRVFNQISDKEFADLEKKQQLILLAGILYEAYRSAKLNPPGYLCDFLELREIELSVD